jgi:AraC-like DNA-binding protein
MQVPRGGVCFAQSVHEKDFRMAERADPFHKLIYVLDGCAAYEERGAWVSEMVPGSLRVVPAGVRHRLIDERPSTLLLLGIDRRFVLADREVRELWATIIPGRAKPWNLPRPARLRLEADWRRALLENWRPRPGRGCALRAAVLQILVLLARQTAVQAGDSAASRVAAVARELEETFFEPWDLDRGAARAGLSRRRFSALFREETGRGFLEQLTEWRLDHAARLLREGEPSVVGVMFACGFNDLSHFYRLFRGRFGRPPRAWSRVTV